MRDGEHALFRRRIDASTSSLKSQVSSLKSQASHILLLNKAYPPWPGGIERHVRHLAEGLAGRGWIVSVLCSGSHAFSSEERLPNLRIHRTRRWGTVWSQPISPGILWQTRQIKADIVHVHTPFPLGMPACLLRGKPTPLVVTWHSDVVRQRFARPLLAPLEHLLLQRSAAIVATSPPLVDQSRILRRFRQKCHVIPLGIDPTPFTSPDPAVRELAGSLRTSLPRPLVVFVGRLVGYKGVDVLIRALQPIDVSALIVGDGPLRPALERLARREGVERRVKFVGHVPDHDLPAYLHAADVFVLPSISRNEAFGMCQLEAMAAGLPVISTDLPGGVPWVNRHNETGLVVPPKDVQALAEAIATITSNPEHAKTFGEQGRRRVLEYFTLDRSLKLHEELYCNLLPSTPLLASCNTGNIS